jgi:hypothetical protein
MICAINKCTYNGNFGIYEDGKLVYFCIRHKYTPKCITCIEKPGAREECPIHGKEWVKTAECCKNVFMRPPERLSPATFGYYDDNDVYIAIHCGKHKCDGETTIVYRQKYIKTLKNKARKMK